MNTFMKNSQVKPKKEYALDYSNLCGGLNLWELDYRLRRGESPEMKNLVWREGTLNCRDGQVLLDGTPRGCAWAMAEKKPPKAMGIAPPKYIRPCCQVR